MNVPSLAFLGFTAVAALLFNLSRARSWQSLVLLLANLYFFASFAHGIGVYLPFVGFLVLGYLGLVTMQRGWQAAFWPFVLALVAVFIWLKRYSFIPSDMFLPFPYVVIGLSYVFFRVLHLVIDAGQQALPGRVGLVSYINYTLSFPALVSGPIQRYQDYHRVETAERPRLDMIAAGIACERIIIGFFKVAIISVALHKLQATALASLTPNQPAGEKLGTAIVIALSYPFFLYFNFSGYTDFVIGCARFFGIVLPENFDRPFTSQNFINFWSRWHITLSSWLKTYVYNPLLITLMRRLPSSTVEPFIGVFAFFVTFFLVGVWHGQTSEFLVFGLLQGGGVALNKLYQITMTRRLGRKRYRALGAHPAYAAICRGLTITWFTFTLFWFWSSWAEMHRIAASLGMWWSLLGWLVIFVALTLTLAAWEVIRSAALSVGTGSMPVLASRYLRTVWGTTLAAISIAVVVLLNAPAPDIVYKAF